MEKLRSCAWSSLGPSAGAWHVGSACVRRLVRFGGVGPRGDSARGRTGSVPKLLDATRKDAQMDPKNTGDGAVMLETQGALALAETTLPEGTSEDEAVTREQRRSRRKRDVRARRRFTPAFRRHCSRILREHAGTDSA